LIKSSFKDQSESLLYGNENSSLLHLFVNVQKLLMQSSLDSTIKEDCDRYDEQIDSRILPLRDVHDSKVSDLAKQIIYNLKSLLSTDLIDEVFPIEYLKPMNNIFNIELKQF